MYGTVFEKMKGPWRDRTSDYAEATIQRVL